MESPLSWLALLLLLLLDLSPTGSCSAACPEDLGGLLMLLWPSGLVGCFLMVSGPWQLRSC